MPIVQLAETRRGLPDTLEIPDQPAHRGGEGDVFFTTDNQYVVKLYHRPPQDKVRLLEHVLDLGRSLGPDERYLAWPRGIVVALNNTPKLGVVTTRLPDRCQPLQRLAYSPREALEQFRQGRNWLDYLKLARAAAAIRTLHGKGMVHADLHLKNFLADPNTSAVTLIDLDGLVVRGFLPPQVKGAPGFMAPEILTHNKTPDELSDRHSAAVLILWILLFRNVMQSRQCYDPEDPARDDQLGYGREACFSEHPTDHRNRVPGTGKPLFRNGVLSYRMLSPKLQRLTDRALIDGLHHAQHRPQVQEWERALAEAYDLLVVCRGCRQTYLYPYWRPDPATRNCPFCGENGPVPPPVVVELFEPRARGTHVPVRRLVLWHKQPLFEDVRRPGTLPPFTRRGTPEIGLCRWDAKERCFRLENRGQDSWQVIRGAGGGLPPGASVLLQPGLWLSLGEGHRLMRICDPQQSGSSRSPTAVPTR